MKRFAEIIISFRWLILACLGCAALLTVPKIGELKVNNSIRIWFVEDDPNLVAFDQFQETFGGEEFIVLGLAADDTVFTPEHLSIIKDIGDDLNNIDGVRRVVSITHSVDVWGAPGEILISPLMETVPRTAEEIEALRSRIYSNPLYAGTIISEDGTTALIIAHLADMAAVDTKRDVIVARSREIARRYESAWNDTIHVAGIPVLQMDLNELTFNDLKTFIPITSFLTIFTIFLTMRRWSAAVLSLLSVGLSVGIVMGTYSLLGVEINMVTTMVPTLVMVIGVADSIHIINHYFERCETNGEPKKSKRSILTETITHIGVPCLMTTVTTAVGFSALATSQMVPVRETGLFTALGIFIAFLITITVIPIGYSLLPMPRSKGSTGRNVAITRLLDLSWRAASSRPRTVIALGMGFFCVSVFFITKITVETQNIEFIRERHPLRQAYDFIEERVGYISPLEVVIEGPPGTAHDPETMKAVEDFQRFLESRPSLSASLAAPDLLKRLSMAYFENDPAHYTLPESREAVAQLLLLYESSPDGELDYFINFDGSMLRVSGRAGMLTSKECRVLMDAVGDYLAEELPPHLSGRMTGVVPLFVDMVDYLIRSQIFSFSLAFVLIFTLLTLQLRSIKLGLISIIPNSIPIAITMGAMGLFHIKLDTATVMISTVAIGIAVDDTIHLLNRYKREYHISNDHTDAVKTALFTSGRAIVSTSFILFLGFWTLLFGSFRPTSYFGFLSGLTMITALLGDLLVLPALLLLIRPRIE
ncbi:MAG: MMPL family transporter [Deltaproteobacteria bacterium]|nr:MMPL family transporter [Candidatus Zymogenaceae bacterium]